MESRQEYAEIVEQIHKVREYANVLERHVDDLRTISDTLEKCETIKVGHDILVPLGSGLFCKAEIKSEKIILNVGAGICVEKTFSEANEIVKKQLAEVSSVLTQVQTNLNYLVARENELRK